MNCYCILSTFELNDGLAQIGNGKKKAPYQICTIVLINFES